MGRFSKALFPLLLSSFVGAAVYYSREEALELAFGKEAVVEMLSLFLDEEQELEVEKLAKVELDRQLYSFYVGKRGDQIIGYAAIESHVVRTKPEALLIVLSPEGKVQKITILAFHEPPEYQPPDWWLKQFQGKGLQEMSWREIDALSGATLSAQAVIKSVRKALALFEVVVRGRG